MPQKQRRFAAVFDDRAIVLDDLAADKLAAYALGEVDRPAGAVPLTSGTAIPIAPELPMTRALCTFVCGIEGEAGEMFGVDLAVKVVQVLDRCQTLVGAA
jgi:hypothetical protein